METATQQKGSDNGPLLLTVLAGLLGAVLVLGACRASSATYDESSYIRIACRWWRTGDQEQITRMGSPLTFWKLQQVPTLWLLDHTQHRVWIDDPSALEPRLLPVLRMGAVWIWGVAFALTSIWARRLHGPWAMVFAAWIFALSPNLIAHGALLTMEMPLIASAAAVVLMFTQFLQTGSKLAFVASAVLAGLAFSCKFTAVLIPPLCGLCWAIKSVWCGALPPARSLARVTAGMVLFVIVLVASDLVVTGFARLPLSEGAGDHPSLAGMPAVLSNVVEFPIPADWVGFATQMRHQRSGGASFLLGERRMNGWLHYYPVALLVKVPPVLWLLVVCRLLLPRKPDCLLAIAVLAYLGIAIVGSSRNYGVRYLLPMAPLAIVWISALAAGGRLTKVVAILGVIGYGIATFTTHPRELSYFHAIVGGPEGGRRILGDSNLDWGQGLLDLERLQIARPEYRDLTLYYFGDTDPKAYGVVGVVHVIDASDQHLDLPARFSASTRFVAVSASLQFGPWGPPGYFSALRSRAPVAHLPDWSISIYAVSPELRDLERY